MPDTWARVATDRFERQGEGYTLVVQRALHWWRWEIWSGDALVDESVPRIYTIELAMKLAEQVGRGAQGGGGDGEAIMHTGPMSETADGYEDYKYPVARAMMSDTEQGRCDFCGDKLLVAVSEQHSPRAAICAGCALWALDELRTAEKESKG